MLRAELLKLTTTRATLIAVIIGLLGVATTQWAAGWLLPSLASLDPGLESTVTEAAATGPEQQLAALNVLGGSLGGGSLGIGLVAVLLLGAMVATTDFRYGGIVGTALVEPRRGALVLAKAGAAAVVVAVTAVGYALVQFALVAASPDVVGSGGYSANAPATIDVLGRGILTLVLIGVIGMSVGMLVRGQTTAFLLLIGAAVLDPVVRAVLVLVPGADGVASYLPLALASTASGPAHDGTMPPLVALGILATLAVAALGAAVVTHRRRDL